MVWQRTRTAAAGVCGVLGGAAWLPQRAHPLSGAALYPSLLLLPLLCWPLLLLLLLQHPFPCPDQLQRHHHHLLLLLLWRQWLQLEPAAAPAKPLILHEVSLGLLLLLLQRPALQCSTSTQSTCCSGSIELTAFETP
jgi:hypothetical protein